MEKENFLEKLKRLVDLAKTKQNALDITEINNFFAGDNLSTEQMEQISNLILTCDTLGEVKTQLVTPE